MRSRLLLTAPLIAATAACFLAGPTVPGGGGVCRATRGQEMVDLLNAMREREGLFPLRVDRRLMAAAQAHVEDMAEHGFVGHDGSDGSLPAYRVDSQRYPWVYVAENTAGGLATAALAFRAWQDSPAHHANNINSNVRHVGVGYVEKLDAPQRYYWVAVFGASLEAPLTPPGGCHP